MYNYLQNQSLSLGQKRALNKVQKSERKIKTDLRQGLKMDETRINQNLSGQLFWPRLYINTNFNSKKWRAVILFWHNKECIINANLQKEKKKNSFKHAAWSKDSILCFWRRHIVCN